MKEEKEQIAIIGTILLLLYVILVIIYNHSLFRNYFAIPTTLIIIFYTILLPIKSNKVNDNLDKYFQFSNSVIIMVLILLTFVIVNEKQIIPNNLIHNAFYSVGVMLIFLFATLLFSILGKNIENKKNMEIICRLSLFMFIMAFVVLISFISGLSLSQ